jgi:hypothetical protein
MNGKGAIDRSARPLLVTLAVAALFWGAPAVAAGQGAPAAGARGFERGG